MASMEIEVRLFAMLRERAGSDSLTIELEDGATVRDAISVVERQPGLGEVISRMPVVMAVNREYAPEDCKLSEGDEVALIPPVSGGEDTEPGAVQERDDGMSRFSTGDGYGQFMELVGKHVPRPPAYIALLGARPLHVEPGHMRFEFNASEQLLNPAGVVQGGFITAMLDETMGPAALAALGPGHMVPTLELKVSFLRPVRPGRLVSDARVVHRGKSVVFLESSLRDDDGALLATATATARIVELERPE
jgi:molybdopterin converting factor subunit 1